MPSLKALRSRSKRAQEKINANTNDGSPEPASRGMITNNEVELSPSTTTPSKSPAKRRKRGGTEAADGVAPSPTRARVEGGDAQPDEHDVASTASSSISPSPHQVTSDLIDATCHEIILLDGEDPEAIAPYASYVALAKRLEYYMEQLEDHDMGDEEELEGDDGHDTMGEKIALKDVTVRCRLFMANLLLEVCARHAYPEGGGETQAKNDIPALIDSSASQWNDIRLDLGKLRNKMQTNAGDGIVDPLFESLICQMDAFALLAKLRAQLLAVLDDVEFYDTEVERYLEEYKSKSDVIRENLLKIHQTSYSDLFVPHQMLTLKKCDTLGRLISAVTTLVEGIDNMITKKVFPLQNFQVQLMNLLKNWNKSYLPLPALFKAGYFKSSKSSTSQTGATISRGSTAQSSRSVAAASPGGVKRGGGKPRKADKKSPAKDDFDFDSDDSVVERTNKYSPKSKKVKKKDESPLKKSPPKKAKTWKIRSHRVPYSEDEKHFLLEGVRQHGKQWAKILDEYDDIFSVNNRTNVNLKDLYRTLMKKKNK